MPNERDQNRGPAAFRRSNRGDDENRDSGERAGRTFREDHHLVFDRDRSGGQGQSRWSYQTGQRRAERRGQGGGGDVAQEYPEYGSYGYGASTSGGDLRRYGYERGGSGFDYEGPAGSTQNLETLRSYGGYEGYGSYGGYRGFRPTPTVGEGGGAGDRVPYESPVWSERWRGGHTDKLRARGGTKVVSRGGGGGGYLDISEQQRGRSLRGIGPKGYTRGDTQIRDEVCERLEDADLDPSDVTVTVEAGAVKLTGTVEDRWIKRNIEDIAHQARGVKDVRNELRVASKR